jgi:hypothetical protein
MRHITLTKAMREWAEWAVDAMADLSDEEREGLHGSADAPLPEIDGAVLMLPDCAAVIEDLLYRLEEQARDVSATDATSPQQAAARHRAAVALALARLIRKSLNGG